MFLSRLFILSDINTFRLCQEMEVKYFYLALLAVIAVPAYAFQGEISFTGDSVIGENVTITCGWTLAQNESFLTLTFRTLPVTGGQDYFYYQFQMNSAVSEGSLKNVRMSYDQFNVSSNQAVVRIAGLQCPDETNYSCSFVIMHSGRNVYRDYFQYLSLKARPKTPSVTLTPSYTNILESSNVSVMCTANIGRPGLGGLQWKIYRGGAAEVISSDDSRLDKLRNVPQENGNQCTQRVEQTFTMAVSRADQNLSIACFVKNSDFQSQVPDVCSNPTADFCQKTQTLTIVYGVNDSSINVDREPSGAVYQDMSMTLICRADGLPAPNYTWFQVHEDNDTSGDNSTLTGEMVGNSSRLVLTNLVAFGGQQLKYACKASNRPLGQTYTATKEISFQVLMTTTTVRTTTTTTKTTPTTPTIAGGATATNKTGTQPTDKGNDPTNIIIIVVVVVGTLLIIAIIIGIILWRRRSRKEIEEPSEKPHNNRTNLSYQNTQPDLVADKKFTNPSLDNSFTEKKEDGLMYADLTYDNKPRSRKPMAINDSSSEYSDIQMPQV